MSFLCKKCQGCLGECPEVCSWCIYGLCKKPVDEALVKFHWDQYCLDENEYKFNAWFVEYFGLCK